MAIPVIVGCQMTPAPGLISCPFPVEEQTAKILEIVPLGTPRDEAIKRLEEAGIVGNFSIGDSKSTYYCDVWQQGKDERWHINVVLLFDEDGILYGTRPQLATTATDRKAKLSQESADPFADPFLGKSADPFQ